MLLGFTNTKISNNHKLLSSIGSFPLLFYQPLFFRGKPPPLLLYFWRIDKTPQPILAKTNYDIYKFQIFKKITIFLNILNIKQRLCLDCIRHFQRATSQGYINYRTQETS